MVACLLMSASAVAQQYFNFELASAGKVYFQGSLITSTTAVPGTGGTFSGLASGAIYTQYGAGQAGATSYGVTSSSAISGNIYGNYSPSGSLYFVQNANFGFRTSAGAYIIEGSVTSEKAAGFSIFSATYSPTTNTYTKGSAIVNGSIKALAAGTTDIYGTFSNTTTAEVPEIDGANLPRAILLFFCVLTMAAKFRYLLVLPKGRSKILLPPHLASTS